MRIAVIPARGGSVRIPRKNIKVFRGKPMMQWPIEAAQASGVFDHIVVSTDDLEIADLARALNCEVHIRKEDDGSLGTQELGARVMDWFRASGVSAVIYPCSPMLTPEIIKGAVQVLHHHGSDYVMSVTDDGKDAGCLYVGFATTFRARVPLDACRLTAMHAHSRLIDINTPEDWATAESMFDAISLRRDQ